MVISSLAASPGSDTLSSITSCDSLQAPHTANISALLQSQTTTVSNAASLDNLPSFTGFSDSFSQSIMTTIEPRVFGAEAEYISRLKTRRDSCPDTADIQRHSVIVTPSQGADHSPEPDLALASLNSLHSYLSDNASDKILLKEEPVVTSKVDQILLSAEFGGPGGVAGGVAGPGVPNFLHFTPDESVTQSVLSQCNKQEPEQDQTNT